MPIDLYKEFQANNLNPDNPNLQWQRNVRDELKPLSNEEIKNKLRAQSLPFSVLMGNITQDFNVASVIRSANAFGARDIFYYGKKHIDRRGALGCYIYKDIYFLRSFEEIKSLKERFVFVALEQTKNSINLKNFQWPRDKEVLIITGEESCGVSKEILDICDFFVEIDQSRGSVRSLNVASAATVCFFDYASKLH